MPSAELAIALPIKLVSLALGAFVMTLAARALRAKRTPHLWLLVAGFALLSMGVITEAVAYQGAGLDLGLAHVLEAIVTLLGFASLVASLLLRAPKPA